MLTVTSMRNPRFIDKLDKAMREAVGTSHARFAPAIPVWASGGSPVVNSAGALAIHVIHVRVGQRSWLKFLPPDGYDITALVHRPLRRANSQV